MIRILAFLAALIALAPTQARAQASVIPYCLTTGTGTNQFQPCSSTWPLAVSGSTGAPYAYVPLTPSQNGTTVASSTALTVPAGATYAVVCVETQGVRWTWDGTTTPTSSVGNPIAAGQCSAFSGATVLANLRFIQQASSATIDVEYAK